MCIRSGCSFLASASSRKKQFAALALCCLALCVLLNVSLQAQSIISPRATFVPHHHLLAPVTGAHIAPSAKITGVTTDVVARPIPGGDVLGPPDFPPVLVQQFLPGPDIGFDGLNAEPNGITDFRGLAALAYTVGTATDTNGNTYIAQTDIRLYQGEYIALDGSHQRGTFVEI